MPFELETATKAKLADVVVLSQKHREPEEDPGVKLSFELELTNHALAQFDGALKSFLYTRHASGANGAQGSLDGIEPVSDAPHLSGIGAHVGVLHWDQDLTGYELVIDLGLGGKRSNLLVEDCALSNWRIAPKQGGTVVVKFDAESADVSEQAFGKLAKLKSREIDITLRAPALDGDALDLHDDEDDRAPPAPPGPPARRSVAKAVPATAKPAAAVKYRDPATGSTWSGRGLQPKWLKVALASGRQLADFEPRAGKPKKDATQAFLDAQAAAAP